MQEADPKDQSCSALQSQFFSDYPGTLYSDERGIYEELFNKLESIETPDAPETVLERLREAFVALSIEGIAHDVSEHRKPFSALLEACSDLGQGSTLEPPEEEGVAELDLGKALKNRNDNGLLNWRLRYLRKALGPLRKGDFGFIFARPESGKTTFLISEVSNFLPQISLEHPILWIANEEEATGIVSRLYCATLNVPIAKVLEKPSHYVNDFMAAGGNKILLYNSASIGKRKISALAKEKQPSLIIIDQLDKIHGFDAERYDLKMKSIYQWARELAKDYCPVIGVCQAGGTAEGKMWLDMNDVDSSHTAKQGEADWILGIGKSANEEVSSLRYLSILKNKLLGGSESDPALKHSKTQVRIDLEKFIYADIVYK